MFKKLILTFLILTFSLFQIDFVWAYSIPVEDVFSDINSDYKYHQELQTLYDRGMVYPDSEWKFNPRALLNRDEFVWILTEVTCKKCIQPNTALDLINNFEDKQLFFDINKTNKYYYCIASANDDWFVSGYHPWTTCDDWTVSELEKPFCANNTIILEEAIAIILRASWILTNEEAEQMRIDIFNWLITEVLSEDVSPKNLDGSVYSFYPDFKKALEYEIQEVDINGNIKTYTLVEIIDWNIRPKQAISKEMFLRIAYITLKANSCEEKIEGDIALWIDMKNDVSIYDFSSNVYTTCEEGIPDPEWYIWRFYNNETWEEIKKYWEKISDFEFQSSWEWFVYLRVIDNCWNTGEVYTTINVNLQDTIDYFNISIDANPMYWEWPLLVDFEWIVWGWEWPFTYFWDFWDGNNSFGKEPQNIFKEEWVYEVTLYITDINWKTLSATVLIQVAWINNEDIDTDIDSVDDSEDLCPLIPWDIRNNWCPIMEEKCNANWSCKDWYICNKDNICLPEILLPSCEYTWWDVIFWNVVCNSCPCNNSLDFISTLRKCDVIFPAITSTDSKTIFSKWELFEIK